MPDFYKLAKAMLYKNEGCVLRVYNDSLGIPTIGVGRNLRDKGISLEEADILFTHDLQSAVTSCQDKLSFFNTLDPIRKAVLVDMAFNLGINGLLKFKRMLSAVEEGDYTYASEELKDSRWYHQVGMRAERLIYMMKTGEIADTYKEFLDGV